MFMRKLKNGKFRISYICIYLGFFIKVNGYNTKIIKYISTIFNFEQTLNLNS